MEVSKALRLINKYDLLVSYEFQSLYPSAEADRDCEWPAVETAYPFKKEMINAVFEFFIGGNWDELNRSNFLTIKNHNPEKLFFQHILIREKGINTREKIILEEISSSRSVLLAIH